MNQQEMGAGEGALKRSAAAVNLCQTQLRTLNQKLDGQIADMKGKWQGAGSQAFHTLQTAWSEKQEIITSELRKFEDSLLGTEKDNTTTDDNASASFTSLNSGRLEQV